MHFGRQLKVEAYGPWSENYINYLKLKRVIRDIHNRSSLCMEQAMAPRGSSHALYSAIDDGVGGDDDDDDDLEIQDPNMEPDEASKSYTDMKCEILGLSQRKSPRPSVSGPSLLPTSPTASSSSLSDDASAAASIKSMGSLTGPTETTGEEDIKEFLLELEAERVRVSTFFEAEVQLVEVKVNAAENMINEKQGTQTTYTDSYIKKTLFDALNICEELVDYSCLNLVGFTKIVKKFVKYTGFKHNAALVRYIKKSPFVAELGRVTELATEAKRVYGVGFPGEEGVLTQSVEAARSWKRNTILNEFDVQTKKATIKPAADKPLWPVALAVVLLVVFVFVPLFPKESRPAQRCLGVVLSSVVLWVTECWPLFVTSLFIPLSVILSSVMLNADGTQMDPAGAAKVVFAQMFPSNVPLILAGFSIAQAFGKYRLDVKIALFILKRPFWRTPARFVIAVELLCFFMSMWISNVAATVLLMTITMPVIRSLPRNSIYAKTLLMATAVSGNVGGMTTQIASPQNAVCASLKEYSVDFVHFSCITLPVCPFLLVLGHLLVMALFKPDITDLPDMQLDEGDPVAEAANIIATERSSHAPDAAAATANAKGLSKISAWAKSLQGKQITVVIITAVSIVLWASSPWLEVFAENIGIISLVPLVAFYGLGLLTPDDFLRMPWNLVILIAGGNVLGEAVESSKLLEMAGNLILELPDNLYLISAVSGIVMLIAGSFVSHTVAALILLRLFGRVGEELGHPKLIVMTSIVMCCGAMPLPISSFPNMNACSLTKDDGTTFLGTVDFLKIGIPCTIFAYIGSNSITYWMAILLGL